VLVTVRERSGAIAIVGVERPAEGPGKPAGKDATK